MKKRLPNSVAILIALVPIIYLATIWQSLPQTVPVHFNAEMKPDRMGDKSELWLVAGLMTGASILVYFLLTNVHKIDPKRKGQPQSGAAFQKLGIGIVVFISALGVLILQAAKGNTVLHNFLFPLLGLLFAFIGNYMVSIKPNYFAGFRLPWTLSNDENWRKTHQLGGRLWFAGGMLIAVGCLFLPGTIAFPFFLGLVFLMIIIPAVYSYRLFKKQS
jgi:uncharacterized membrane protein